MDGTERSAPRARVATKGALDTSETETITKGIEADDWIAGVSHDFNNLLTLIRANLELTGQSLGKRHRGREPLEQALRAVEHGAALTLQLAAAKDAPLMGGKPAPWINLNQAIAGDLPMLRRALGADIALRLELAPDLWPAAADGALFGCALLNLALNAHRAMPRGGSVAIRTLNRRLTAETATLSPGAYVAVTFSDDGPGLPPAIAPLALRQRVSTKREGGGFGLAQVRRFARASGGDAELETGPGGTAVTILVQADPRPG